MNIYFQHYIEKNVRKINKRTFILSKIEEEMLFKTENLIASIIYRGVSKKGGPNFPNTVLGN